MSESATPKSYRTLFIGLGGTGGRVLLNLDKLLTGEQKAKSHMIYIDLDKGDARDIEALGMPAVVISSSDTVRDVITRLGSKDGVNDWIPTERNDTEFLSSKTDDGASQYRMKSRLCLANFLKNRNNKLAKLLTSMCKVGTTVANETLRVMIVSSVAGGTGAGTFIEVALYIREFFRKNNHKDVSITGLFACPDLFVKTLGDRPGDKGNRENMYANAYAAIRELNAMNLAVSTGGLEKIAPGYGKSINIKIHTQSEGKLFDPKDEKFLENANNKPFNLMYFVDTANEEGGVLTSIDQYYSVMADIVYTRLYSPIEDDIRSGESNELAAHAKFPTAIYGSAGYGRIIYPYEDLIRYLAVRKSYEEVGGEWFAFEDSWNLYCKNRQATAAASGAIWAPSTEERARQYINEMEKGFKNKRSRLMMLKGMMINSETEVDRATEYLDLLDSALESHAMGKGEDGEFSRCAEENVRNQRNAAVGHYNGMAERIETDPLGALTEDVDSCLTAIDTYGRALVKDMAGAALTAAGEIVPQSENAAALAATKKNPLNLFYGLLTAGGQPVHPLAARYLLYKLREEMRSRVENGKKISMESTIAEKRKAAETAMDPDETDSLMVTMAYYYEKELKSRWTWNREGKAKAAAEKFLEEYKAALNGVNEAGNRLYKAAVYELVLEYVEELTMQYEGLFDNLEQYKLDLDRRVHQEAVCNNGSSDDRCIFVNASNEEKAYIYERDSITRNALREGDQAISTAAGKGIYDALMKRTWKKVASRLDQMALQYTAEEEKDKYTDLSDIFDGIIAIYAKYLKEKAPHLQMSVVKALIDQCCLREGIELAELSDPVKRYKVRVSFEEVVSDMIAKACPMLAYDPNNADTYYQGEDVETETKVYTHMGMNPSVLKDLLMLYGAHDEKGAREEFVATFGITKGVTDSDAFDRYTISCFSAVHCLQPTQILKFREDFSDGYYHYYKKRLAMITNTGCLSFTPHLDKRWHLREAMPYISRKMELEWHKKTAKAFIYEMLKGHFTFTTTGDGTKCFNYVRNEGEAPIFVTWPVGQVVTVNHISRLIEYLEEQDERVEELNAKYDAMISNLLIVLDKFIDDVAVYKAALTKHEDLRNLRECLCRVLSLEENQGKKHKKKEDTEAAKNKEKEKEKAKTKKEQRIEELREASRLLGCDESVEALVNVKQTLGGLLQMAWMVHKSEERQGRDKDYGEAMIEVVLETVEKLCAAVCGVNVAADTTAINEYKDLYNAILEKFMEAYVKFQLVQRNMFNAKTLEDYVGAKCTDKGIKPDYAIFYRYLKVPSVIFNSKEYLWIKSLWLPKK